MIYGKKTKVQNAARVMREIWMYDGISRIEVARRIGLDKSTVTNLVNSLMDLGIVEETRIGVSSPQGGRKPIALGIREDYGAIVGVEVQAEGLTIAVVNLSGQVLMKWRKKINISKNNFVEVMCDQLEAVYEEAKNSCPQILGVGIGTGGLINPQDGTIMYSIPLDIYEPFHVVEQLSERLTVPVFVENDANCCAWGELSFHRSPDLANFLFVLVEFNTKVQHIEEHGGVGVGLGIVLNGNVHYGSNSSAGEFRSVLWDGGDKCQFHIPPSELTQISENPDILKRFTNELTSNLALMINSFDMGHVFFGGDIENYDIDLKAHMYEALDRNWMYSTPKKCEVHLSSLKELAVAYGAAGMLLDRLFTDRISVSNNNHGIMEESLFLSEIFQSQNATSLVKG